MLGTTIGTLQTDKFNSFKRDAFGKLFANSTNNEYNMFTGKPDVEGLGYAFLFRNYRADLGKWQTADPLGYPDGWNNLAYVNNGVIGCIDRFGTDIYHVVDTEGAFANAGHSAYIIGNSQTGYTAYDYQANGSSGSGSGGSSSNSESRTKGGFTTPEAALAFLNSNRDTVHNFDKGQKWTTSLAEDVAANAAAATYMGEDYALTSHNCYQLGPQAIANAINTLRDGDSNDLNMHSGPIPNRAFDYNNEYGGAITVITE